MADSKPNPPTYTPQATADDTATPDIYPKKVKLSSHAKIAVAVIVLVILGGISAYLYHKNNQPAPYSQKYNTNSYGLVAADAEGHGISFKKMDQLVSIGKPDGQYEQAYIQLSKVDGSKNTYIAITRLNVKAKNFPSPAPTKEQIERLGKILADPNSKDYELNVSDIKIFAQSAFPEPNINVSLGKSQPFTNSTIKANAWQFDLSAVDSSGQSPDFTGKVLYIIGNHNTYYFLTGALKDNWNSNSAAFQSVLDSIKINV